jgi:hypothetical protein
MVATRSDRSATLDGSDITARADRPLTTSRADRPLTTVPAVASTGRRQLLWIVTALVTGWMTATITVVVVAMASILPGSNAPETIAVGTALFSILAYVHFRRLGRIDESVVLAIVICWTAMLGLLSL